MVQARIHLLGALVALALFASFFPTSAAANGVIRIRGPIKFLGENWIQEIVAIDGSTDSVTVSLSRPHVDLDHSTPYRLREEHTYTFPDLPASSVAINDNLTGSIDVVGPLHTGGLLTLSLDLVKIDGQSISSRCGGDVQHRDVAVADGSVLSLVTANTVFGTLGSIPQIAKATVEKGHCTKKPPCRAFGRALIGTSSRDGVGDLRDRLQWEKRYEVLRDKTTIDVSLQKGLASTFEDLLVGSRVVSLSGTVKGSPVKKSDVRFAPQGLPLLSGEAVVADLGSVKTGSTVKCSSLEGYRLKTRTGTQSGDLAFEPTGLLSESIDSGWTSSRGVRELVDWYELGPPTPPVNKKK